MRKIDLFGIVLLLFILVYFKRDQRRVEMDRGYYA